MAINLNRERLITLLEAAGLMPRRRRNRPVHASTLWRWHRRGVKVGTERVYLEVVVTPSGAATTVEALQDFLRRLSRSGPHVVESNRTASDQVGEAVQALDKSGI